MSIYIFSGPIHSGKTTALLQWCNRHSNIAGVLMPDINGSRKILDIKTKEVFDIECTDQSVNDNLLVSVGRFYFYTSAFEKANSILTEALAENHNWLVIDEAGKLELDEKGFYPSLKKAVEFYNSNKTTGNLLVTLRDSLCEEIILFFKINNCRIVQSLEELT